MLLAQPFDPFKEQQRKLSFFAKVRLFSRTRRALCELKNRMHDKSLLNNRQFHQQAALMIPDHQRFLMNGPPPPPSHQGWYPPCYGYCYDPYFSSPPMMFPPPLQSFSMPPPQQVPYCLCIHFTPSHQQSPSTYYNHHENPSSIPTESTLYSSSSSMYSSGNEKELVEQVEYDIPQHPLEKNKRSSYPTMTRRNSDILPNRPGRPSLNRWNTSRSSVYYN